MIKGMEAVDWLICPLTQVFKHGRPVFPFVPFSVKMSNICSCSSVVITANDLHGIILMKNKNKELH